MPVEPTFDPIAFQLGPLTVHWYGIILGTAAFLGLMLAVRESKRLGMNPDIFVDLLMFAVPAAIIGARLYYVIFEWGYYSSHPAEIIAVWNGGIAIHGALLASVLTAWIFTRVRGLSFWKLADIAAPSIILGQAIGRWGNFINQEAHGREVSRSFLEGLMLPDWIVNQMYIEQLGYYVHPTFLYESLWNLLGLALLIGLRYVNLRRGDLFLSYVIWYSFGRFFIEGMRTDSLYLMDTIRVAQLISIVLIALAVILMVVRRRKGYADKRYADT